MQELIKNWPSILLLFAGIAAAWSTYVANNRTEKQQQNIEKLGEINKELGIKNKDLSEEVKKLSELNNSIAQENKKLGEDNISLSSQTKELIEKVNKLTTTSYTLINKLDIKTEKEFAENAITGELEMEFDLSSKESKPPIIIIGGGPNDAGTPIISIGSFMPIITKKINNKLLISMKVYDLRGNLIAEIEDNKWRPNKNFSGKYNYDKKGFEVINNQGNIAASFDIVGPNTIKVQGIFPYIEQQRILILGNNGFTYPPFGSKEIEEKVERLTGKKYDDYLKEQINAVPIKQIFEYTGSDWLHKRKKG